MVWPSPAVAMGSERLEQSQISATQRRVKQLHEMLWRVREDLVGGRNLRAKAIRGGVWLGGASAVEQAARFGRNLILVRLLAPQAFGSMAIALSLASVISTLTDVGIREAIIQNPKGHEEDYFNSAWWIAFCRGLALYILAFVFSPVVARFYGSDQLVSLLRITSLSVLFDSSMSPKAVLAVKTMRLERWAAISNGGGITGACATVILALLVPNIWALAFGYCTESAARCALSYICCPCLPKLRFQRAAARDLFQFSKGMFGLSLLNLVFARTDIFVLGKSSSAAALGLYAMAIYLVQTPTSFLMNLLGQTLLPAYSQVHTDRPRLSHMLYQAMSALALLGFPFLTCVFFCGPSVLTLTYGPKYTAMATPLFVAAIVALVNVLNGQLTTVFYAVGKPQLHRTAVAAMAATMAICVYPLTKRFGLTGGQVSALISVSIGFGLQIIGAGRVIRIEYRNIGRIAIYSAVASMSVASICLAAKAYSGGTPARNITVGLAACFLPLTVYAIAYGRDRQKRAPLI